MHFRVGRLVYLWDPLLPQTMRHSRNELQSTQKAPDRAGRQMIRLKQSQLARSFMP